MKKLHHDSLRADVNSNPSLLTEMGALENEFRQLFDSLKPSAQDQVLTKYFRSLTNRIVELHNELERRDSFMRGYSEDFTHPATGITIKDKILYDEKEWRSIKFADKADYTEASKNQFLPPKDNLLFDNNDVLAILLEDDATLSDVKDYILNNKTLLDPAETTGKLKVIDDYKE